nr:biotin--[acetyl-CoA-carboxylase] ligase [Sneathiella chinensis]
MSAFETIGSTNDEAKRLADSGTPEGQLIWSRIQTSGVGRRGRNWASPSGNLYCSILLRPECNATEGAKLSFAVAVALYQAFTDLLPNPDTIALKWPNDVLIRGQKSAGILLESKSGPDGMLEWLVIGTGVNVTSFPEKTDGLPATSLAREGANTTAEAVLENYAACLLALYKQWKSTGFDAIRKEWMRHATGIGNPITVRLADRELPGIFEGLDETGALILAEENGTKKLITAGEVFFNTPVP